MYGAVDANRCGCQVSNQGGPNQRMETRCRTDRASRSTGGSNAGQGNPDEREQIWLEGMGWKDSDFKHGPTKAMLDQIVPDRPLFLAAGSGHAAWLNNTVAGRRHRACASTCGQPGPYHVAGCQRYAWISEGLRVAPKQRTSLRPARKISSPFAQSRQLNARRRGHTPELLQ